MDGLPHVAAHIRHHVRGGHGPSAFEFVLDLALDALVPGSTGTAYRR